MSLQNPMNLTAVSPTNYVQPNTAAPAVNANVASYPVGANVLNLTWPIPAYTQPVDPHPAPAAGQLADALGDSINP